MEFTVRQPVDEYGTPQVTDLCRHMGLRIGNAAFGLAVVRVELTEDGREAQVTCTMPDSEIIPLDYDRERGGDWWLSGYRSPSSHAAL